MGHRDYSQILKEAFPEEIRSVELKYGNELYVDVKAAVIREISLYLHKEMGCALLSLFACDEREERGHFVVNYVFGDRKRGILIVLRIPAETEFPSVSRQLPGAALYEREIKDLFGLVPQGHPDARRLVFHGNWPGGNFPLRKDFDRKHKPEFVKKAMQFRKVKGGGTYEIPVGPVHAGIIEPGHFRFSVAGEPIINLEAQLYFVHKGIEKLCEGMDYEKVFYISERISGDETFSNSLAYCQAVEKIAGVQVPERASYTRVIFAELERLICHFGDLSGICTDVAYGFASSHFNMLRIWSYQLADALCGVRFLRSVNAVGGVRRDFLKGKKEILFQYLDRIQKELEDIMKIVRRNNLFVDRIEHTGVLKKETAMDLNAVGPGGRASGIRCDARKAFAYEMYEKLEWEEVILQDGDVAARMEVKAGECFASISMMKQAAEAMKGGEFRAAVGPLPANACAFGITESSRGENVHFVLTDGEGKIGRYKVRTPSFCNWPALCHAVNGNIVPDFPLINKSFNLSYAGNDL